MATIGVVGGGIAGLTAAYRLQALGHDVRVFEKAAYAGGKIRSERAGDYLIEHGPNTLTLGRSPVLDALLDELGLRDARLEAAPEAKRRYVVRNGTPVPLPTSLTDFIGSGLLSTRAKLRLVAEPLIRAPSEVDEESIATFVRRRLGREVLDYGVNPFVAGVFAGDPERLSLPHAFPRLHALEKEHGSLAFGLLKTALRRKRSAKNHRLFSFQNGLQTLPDALVRALGETVISEAAATALHKRAGRWVLFSRRSKGKNAIFHFDAVLYAAPLHTLGTIDIDTGLDLTPLAQVPYPPVSVVAFGLPHDQIDHPLDGFGLLVPDAERNFRILGTLFSSTLFPNRAPNGHALLTTFVGGTRRPELARADTETLQQVVWEDLHELLGLRTQATFVHHAYCEHAIPQYHLGYGRVKECIDHLEMRNPGLFLTGNYRRGISVGDAAASGTAVARRLDAWLD